MKKIIFLLYGLAAYLLFLFSVLYAIAFLGNLGVENAIDGPVRRSLFPALLINGALIVQFGLQHSIMARRWFKEWLVRIIPKPVERSTYVAVSSLSLLLIVYFWEPLGGTIWKAEKEIIGVVIYALYFLGWTISLVASFLLSHFDLFGLRQVYLHWQGRPYTALDFAKPGWYKKVRHPLYLGYLIAFWAAPHMTVSHLVFSLGFTAYLFVGIKLEEKNLVADFGDRYLSYRQKVPALLPVRLSRICEWAICRQETTGTPAWNSPEKWEEGGYG